jgi:hypothetical protein
VPLEIDLRKGNNIAGDENYWKRLYGSEAWEKSNRREREIMRRIKDESGKVAAPVGLGAGSTELLSGTAESWGLERGGADLHVVETDVYLEVTGPQVTSVRFEDTLWVRPDKIRNAMRHRYEHETWVIHWLERDGTLRVIHMDDQFFADVQDETFPEITMRRRGATERYVEIPAKQDCVRPWSALIDRLRSL